MRSVGANRSRRPELTIVVPAFNEEDRLPELLAALRANLDPVTTEIIVVDDGSDDATSEVARRSLAGMPLAEISRLGRNCGKGAAVRAGVHQSRGRVVAYMDADLATDLISLESLIAALATADLSIGSRAHEASVVEHARLDRTIMGRTFNRFIRTLAGFDHLDTQCGFKAFHRPVAKLLFSMSSVNGFAFDVEILHLAHKLDLRVVEAPVHWQHVDGSKIRPWTDSFQMAADALRLTSRRPTLELSGLELVGCSRLAAASALRQLDERPLVASSKESVDVLFTPGETPDVSLVADHFDRFGIKATPVVRGCDEFFGPRRVRRLSLGLPAVNGSMLPSKNRTALPTV